MDVEELNVMENLQSPLIILCFLILENAHTLETKTIDVGYNEQIIPEMETAVMHIETDVPVKSYLDRVRHFHDISTERPVFPHVTFSCNFVRLISKLFISFSADFTEQHNMELGAKSTTAQSN